MQTIRLPQNASEFAVSAPMATKFPLVRPLEPPSLAETVADKQLQDRFNCAKDGSFVACYAPATVLLPALL
jgi:hypothetical protein